MKEMDMMKEMMGNMSEGFNPMEMSQRMMRTVTEIAKMAGFASPEVQALFNDWVSQVEIEVFDIIKSKKQADTQVIASELKISEDSALYFISKLVRDKKLKITGIEVL